MYQILNQDLEIVFGALMKQFFGIIQITYNRYGRIDILIGEYNKVYNNEK